MQGEKSPRDDSDDEPLIGPDAKMRRLLKDKKLRFSTGEDYLEEEVAGMSQQESQDLNAEAVDEAEARLGKDASNANTPCKDSDDDEPTFGPDAKMRRLLKFEIELMQCFDLWVGTERLKLTCSWMELSQML
jgi:hypothetical protein